MGCREWSCHGQLPRELPAGLERLTPGVAAWDARSFPQHPGHLIPTAWGESGQHAPRDRLSHPGSRSSGTTRGQTADEPPGVCYDEVGLEVEGEEGLSWSRGWVKETQTGGAAFRPLRLPPTSAPRRPSADRHSPADGAATTAVQVTQQERGAWSAPRDPPAAAHADQVGREEGTRFRPRPWRHSPRNSSD